MKDKDYKMDFENNSAKIADQEIEAAIKETSDKIRQIFAKPLKKRTSRS